jgi:hypothetical protein
MDLIVGFMFAGGSSIKCGDSGLQYFYLRALNNHSATNKFKLLATRSRDNNQTPSTLSYHSRLQISYV